MTKMQGPTKYSFDDLDIGKLRKNGQFIGDKRSWCCLGCAKSADRIEQLELHIVGLVEAIAQGRSRIEQLEAEIAKRDEAPSPEACANCRFFSSRVILGSHHTFCRRFPSSVVTRATDWCGEYQKGTDQ